MTRKILLGVLAGFLSIATGASAATLSGHGSLFVAYNAGQAQSVDYTTGGARTNLAAGQTLIAPIIRNEILAGNQSFGWVGSHVGFQTTNCTVFSAQADGTPIASQASPATNTPGIWNRFVSFPAAQLPTQGKVSILCTIPGSFNGTMAGVTSTP